MTIIDKARELLALNDIPLDGMTSSQAHRFVNLQDHAIVDLARAVVELVEALEPYTRQACGCDVFVGQSIQCSTCRARAVLARVTEEKP